MARTEKRDSTYFVVSYRDPQDGKVMTLKASKIQDSSLGLSFVAISGFMFDTDKLVVTPDEEAVAKRMADVKTLHLSIYAILSIQEMGSVRRGLRFKNSKSNLLVLSTPPKA